jgi:hypothetical protein
VLLLPKTGWIFSTAFVCASNCQRNLLCIYTSKKEKLEKRPVLILFNMKSIPGRVSGKTEVPVK